MPFLHVTSRVEGRKHDDLLTDLGSNSTPQVFVLDAKGEIVARNFWPHSTANFQTLAGRLARSEELEKKAAAGDKSAAIDAALVGCELGRLDADELEEQVEEIGVEPNEAQKKAMAVQRANTDIYSLSLMMRRERGPEARKTATDEIVGFYKQGAHPTRTDLQQLYWGFVAHHATQAKDKAMLATAAKAVREGAKVDATLGRLADHLDKLLKDLEGDSK